MTGSAAAYDFGTSVELCREVYGDTFETVTLERVVAYLGLFGGASRVAIAFFGDDQRKLDEYTQFLADLAGAFPVFAATYLVTASIFDWYATAVSDSEMADLAEPGTIITPRDSRVRAAVCGTLAASIAFEKNALGVEFTAAAVEPLLAFAPATHEQERK